MENNQFDRLTRLVARFTSRRSLVQGVAAGGLASALGLVGAGVIPGIGDEAEAGKRQRRRQRRKEKEQRREKKRKNKNKCNGGQRKCAGECIPANEVCFVRVTTNSLQGWLLEGEDAFSQDPALTQIVTGPGTPPEGTGSVKLSPTAFGEFAQDQTQAVLRTLQYEGTTIGDIDRLEYSIFVPSTAGDPPTMQLAVVNVNNQDNFTSLVFLPSSFGNTAPVADAWTSYTPSSEGFFGSTRDVLGPNGECLICRSIGSKAHEGQCTDPALCAAATGVTWANIQAAMPDAELNNSGSFSFRIGRSDTGTGHVARVVINGDGYFFEED